MRWSRTEFEAYENRRSRLRADNPKSTQGNALECPPPRESQSGSDAPKRLTIRFDVYAVYPCDWDGYSIKELQDMLVHAGVIPSDKWDTLQGTVVSHKAQSKETERTEITIE